MAGGSKRNDAESGIPLQDRKTEYYRSIFDHADKDHDGFINLVELDEMIRAHELVSYDIPPQVLNRIHSRADTDVDGKLDFAEFVAMVTDPTLTHIFGRYVNRYVNFIVPRNAEVEVDGAYERAYSFWPPPLGMILISAIEAIFFITDEWNERYSTQFASGPMAKLFIYDPELKKEFWRFATYMFVHIGKLHLIVNLIVQLFLGLPLEMVHGWFRILTVYTSGVVAGSLVTSVTDPRTQLAGASGGVYSLITAHIATIIMNWKEMSYPLVQLAIILILAGSDVGSAIYDRYSGKLDQHIGYAAHFGGALAGILVGINVLRNLKVTKKEQIIAWVALVIYLILMVALLLFNIFGDLL